MKTLKPRTPKGGPRIEIQITDEQYETWRATGRLVTDEYTIRRASCGLGCRCDAIATPRKPKSVYYAEFAPFREGEGAVWQVRVRDVSGDSHAVAEVFGTDDDGDDFEKRSALSHAFAKAANALRS